MLIFALRDKTPTEISSHYASKYVPYSLSASSIWSSSQPANVGVFFPFSFCLSEYLKNQKSGQQTDLSNNDTLVPVCCRILRVITLVCHGSMLLGNTSATFLWSACPGWHATKSVIPETCVSLQWRNEWSLIKLRIGYTYEPRWSIMFILN